MVEQILVLSGPVSSGKTTLARRLSERFGLEVFKTRELLQELGPAVESERGAMQAQGERLDKKTRGQWVADGLARRVQEHLDPRESYIVVVDAVRIKQQIAAVRRAFGNRVVHIHLVAPEHTLRQRYEKRQHDGIKELCSYKKVRRDPTEAKIGELEKIADVVIDTDQCDEADVMAKAAGHLRLYGRENARLVDVVVGGQYGSEGKGHIVSYLAGDYDLLVRVGGPNAGHTVYDEPAPYTFHHLPSGTRSAPGARLLIGPGATIWIPGLLQEISDNQIDCERLSIDPQAMVITKADRNHERSLVKSMGSTGQGGGIAASRRIKYRQPGRVKLARDYRELTPFIRPACAILEDAFRRSGRVLLEGTQGTGLSLYHGIYPFVTSRDTTVAGCLAEAGISPSRTRKIVMVCRTYPIRVQNPPDGTSGPLREIEWEVVERRAGLPKGCLKEKERTSTTKRERRVGEFEWAALRSAASLNAPTDIALTFVDYIDKKNARARRFGQLTEPTIRFIEEVERVAGAPVSLISTRFSHANRSIIDRRAW